MKVTTKTIITLRPSMCVPARIVPWPVFHHVMFRSTASRRWPECGRAIHTPAEITANTNEEPTAAMPTSEPFRGSRRPKKRMTRNETNGTAGISQALRRKNTPLPLHHVDVGEVDALLVAVDE